jgi:hypothetical protein
MNLGLKAPLCGRGSLLGCQLTNNQVYKTCQDFSVIPQLWVQVIQMCPYTPLWKRGATCLREAASAKAGGRFYQHNFKIPLYPPKL